MCSTERLEERFLFRDAAPAEAQEAGEVEAVCFPPNEACRPERIKERIETCPGLFLLAIDRRTGHIAGFLNGLATDETRFRDEFFTDVRLHNPRGTGIMLLGLDVMPEYRRQGLAGELVRRYAAREKEKGRKRLILTCHPEKIEMYRKFGFVHTGDSDSFWGGEPWQEMVMEL